MLICEGPDYFAYDVLAKMLTCPNGLVREIAAKRWATFGAGFTGGALKSRSRPQPKVREDPAASEYEAPDGPESGPLSARTGRKNKTRAATRHPGTAQPRPPTALRAGPPTPEHDKAQVRADFGG
jgi:hypothetical protein